MLEIPADLDPSCAPLGWLLGRWEGVGVGEYPGTAAFQFGQELQIGYASGAASLTHSSRIWVLEDGRPGRPYAAETGYWRPQPDGDVELVLAHSGGVVEVYLGRVEPARVQLATRGVLRTESAPDYRAGSRLYGAVRGNLLWVMEQVAGQVTELTPHLSAELRRVAAAAEVREERPA